MQSYKPKQSVLLKTYCGGLFCGFWWLSVLGLVFFFQLFCFRIARGLQIRNADEQMCVGQPFLGVLHSQERMGRAHHESCSGGRLCWLSVARLPPPPPHRIHCILYWPKNSQGPRRSLQGGRQLTLQAQSFPAYGLLHHKDATTKKTVFPPVFHFLHLLAFQEGKCYLPEV